MSAVNAVSPPAADLRAQLRQAQRQLLHAEKMAAIGQLAAGVAHEINNPIGYVLSNIGALAGYVNDLLRLIRAYERSGASSAELQRLSREIDVDFLAEDILSLVAESQDGIDRVKQIVHSLKDFSRADDGGEFVRADLRQCIESALNMVHTEIKYKSHIRKELAELPPVQCRPTQIGQVIMNLLVNAGQAISRDGEIVLRTSAHEGGALIEVIDNGSGIAREHLDRIFEPFFTTKPDGTGLGLWVSRTLVEQHGGELTGANHDEGGAVFTLRLPCRGPL
jgi:two-component system NtrC family sensor kinase